MRVRRSWTASETQALTIVPIVFLAVGALLLTIGIVLGIRWQRFREAAHAAQGEVVRLVRDVSRDSDGGESVTYRPLVQFKTSDGRGIEFESSTGSNPASYAPGDPVRVLYDPARPGRAAIDDFSSAWFMPILFSTLGIFFAGFGAGIIVFVRRAARTRATAV